jgi:PAS domain S-box-containing protein
MLPPDELHALFQGTIDAIEDSIKIISPKYEILYINKAAEKQHGKRCQDVIGKLCFSELGGKLAPCAHCAFRTVIEKGISQQVEFTKIEDGQKKEFEQAHYPLRTPAGEIIGVIEITHEITERRRFERQLLHTEKLAAIGQLSAVIAHEIRNPLTGIRLGIDALLEDAQDVRQKESLEAIIQDVRRLDDVLKQLLDFTKRKKEERTPIQVPELLEKALFFIRKQAQKQHVEIKLNISDNLPPVIASGDQLLQVILNILLNALQAMPEGGELRIRADRLTHGNQSGILVTVQDTGKGFPQEYKDKLFDMFFSTKPSGSGVGLAVSSKIIAEHGGAIWVESPPELGALVNIFLPLTASQTSL